MAIEDRRATFITYQSLHATEPVSYDVYPLGLVWHRASLYLVGHAPHHNAIRHWKVNRIQEVEPTNVQFQRPDGFDLKKHLANSFAIFQGSEPAHVVVRFMPPVVRYVQEHEWRPGQKLDPQPDGSLLAAFDLDGTEEIKQWILSFGRHAVVLEPKRLREEMTREVSTMLQQYETAKKSGPLAKPAR
jgi:proteasome accessory factor B